MRIPTGLFSNNFLYQIEKISEKIFWNNQRIATQKQLQMPSDDPIGASIAIKLRKNMRFNDKYIENTEDAISWLSSSEIAVNSFLEQLTIASELATSGASDPIGSSAREALGNEVDQLLEQMVATANTQVKGKFIFGGFETLTPPYAVDDSVANQAFNFTAGPGDTVNLNPPARIKPGTVIVRDGGPYVEGTDYTIDYEQGTITSLTMPAGPYFTDYGTQIYDVKPNPFGIDGAIKRKIAEGETIRINLSGNEIFNLPTKDTFDVLIDLRDALYANDSSAIQASLAEIETASDTMRAGVESIGARLERLNEHLINLTEFQTARKGELSKIEDVDMATELVDLQKNEVALQAALQSGTRVMQLSIMNFLG